MCKRFGKKMYFVFNAREKFLIDAFCCEGLRQLIAAGVNRDPSAAPSKAGFGQHRERNCLQEALLRITAVRPWDRNTVVGKETRCLPLVIRNSDSVGWGNKEGTALAAN